MPRKLPQGWLRAYSEYTAQQESPEPFHIWVALSVLSGAARRHIWIDQGHYTLYPNLYVVLVAPPGKAKKSVAMGMGLRLLRQVPNLNVESNKMTPQALIHSLAGGNVVVKKVDKKKKKSGAAVGGGAASAPDDLTNPIPTADEVKQRTIRELRAALAEDEVKPKVEAKAQAQPQPNAPAIRISFDCTATLASSEFSVMLGVDAQQNGMLALLTDLFDSPDTWEYKTLSRETEKLNNVFINVLAATTPEWLGSSIPTDAIGGGFTSRILFVAQNQRRMDCPRPKLTKRELELRKLLLEDLIHIASLEGEITLDSEAEVFFDEWYRTRDRSYMDERFWGYLERKPDHLLKVSSLLSISFNDDLVVKREHLEMGLELLDRLESRMPEAFRGVGGPGARDVERVVDQIIEKGGSITFRELVHLNYRHLSSHELGVVIQTMADAGMVVDVVGGRSRTITLRIPNPTSGGGQSGGGAPTP